MTEKKAALWMNESEMAIDTLLAQLNAVVDIIHKRLAANHPISFATKTGLEELMLNSKYPQKKYSEFKDVLDEKLLPLIPHMIDVNHPFCAGHLHCPTLISSISTELLIAALNLSMDSWDQSGAATLIEAQVISWVVSLLHYPVDAGGVFTSGGTQSNLMGILLAREAYAKNKGLRPFTETGLMQSKYALTILCTQRAHFSVTQSARWLGIGSDNVVLIDPLGDSHIRQKLEKNQQQPFVFVATAGCTDFGEIDDLEKIREICDQYQLWMHVDAAVGGALLLTKYKSRLQGLNTADSITIDFHKLYFQPISASVFILKNNVHFKLINFYSDYLNRETDAEEGVINLVGKSLQTTRRFDALKTWLTWQHLGLDTLQALIEALIELTAKVAVNLDSQPKIKLARTPSINTLVFRFYENTSAETLDWINRNIRRNLFNRGLAVIGETVFENKVYLKLTLMNPAVSKSEIDKLIQLILAEGVALSSMKSKLEGAT